MHVMNHSVTNPANFFVNNELHLNFTSSAVTKIWCHT